MNGIKKETIEVERNNVSDTMVGNESEANLEIPMDDNDRKSSAANPQQYGESGCQLSSGQQQPTPESSGCARKAAGGCEGCPNRGSCSKASSGPNPECAIIKKRLSQVRNIILILSGKGGVGKSTVCTQLAYTLSQKMKKSVGILDIDICGPSIPTLTGTVGAEVNQIGGGWEPVQVDGGGLLSVLSIAYLLMGNNDPIIWRGPRKTSLIQSFLANAVWGPLDYLLIDTPPGTSDEHISILSLLSESLPDRQAGCVIVTTPQEVALADVRREANFCKTVNLPVIGVIENMSGFICPHCGECTEIFKPSTGGAEAMCKDPSFSLRLLGKVPLDIQLAKASEQGVFWQALVEEGKPDAAGYKQFVEIAESIDKILG